MTSGAPEFRRDAAGIAAKLELRAERAVAHTSRVARGVTPRACPVCGYEGMFSPVKANPDFWCPGCDSRPRHRLVQLWLDRELRLPDGARVLHFAAEPWARAWFEARGAAYVTADIEHPSDLRLDITAMDLPDAAFDVILANHVLEHVDDRAALAEMHRVLAPGGQAVVTVPVIEGWDETYEDPALTTPGDRALHYGNAEHLRFYGRDVRQRIRAAGFALIEYSAVEPDVSRHALRRGERVFVGRKPA